MKLISVPYFYPTTGHCIERLGKQAGQAQEPRGDLLVADHGGARPRRPRLHRGTEKELASPSEEAMRRAWIA